MKGCCNTGHPFIEGGQECCVDTRLSDFFSLLEPDPGRLLVLHWIGPLVKGRDIHSKVEVNLQVLQGPKRIKHQGLIISTSLHIIISSMPEETVSSPNSTVSPIDFIPRLAESRGTEIEDQKRHHMRQTNASMITFTPSKNPILFQNRGRRLSQLRVNFRTDSEQTNHVLGPDPHGYEIESSPPIDDTDHQRRLKLSRGVDYEPEKRYATQGEAIQDDASSAVFTTDDESSSSANSIDMPLVTKVDCSSKPTASTRSTLSMLFEAKVKFHIPKHHLAISSSPPSTEPSSISPRRESIPTVLTVIPGPRLTSTRRDAETQMSGRDGSVSTRFLDTDISLAEVTGTQAWQYDGHPGW